MTDDPLNRLEEHASGQVPDLDPGFADRLEAKLRVQHVERPGRRAGIGAVLPQLGVALVMVVVGIFAVLALTGRDAGLPVSVVDGEPIAPADQPDTGNQDPADAGTAPSPTATARPSDVVVAPGPATTEPLPTPTPTEAPLAAPSAVVVAPTPTPVAAAASPTEGVPEPSPTPVPATSVPATPVRPAATATAIPVRPTAVPERPVPTPTPTATATPEPTPTAIPATMSLTCQARVAGDAVGVSCEWTPPAIDVAVAGYELMRSRNGGETGVVVAQRVAAETVYVDRDVAVGDEVIYLVRALTADRAIVAASERQTINID